MEVRVALTLFDLMALAVRFGAVFFENRVVLLNILTFEGRFVGLKPHIRALARNKAVLKALFDVLC
ncbi:MAG: hypothetical protein LBL74_06415 [Bacteroidales bacterium]|nr:hypothetical protein [Bacteroidales bacterium]